jgi:hypothetical protein
MFAVLGWVMVAAAVMGMYRIADVEDRNALLWAGITLVVCLACGFLIPLPLVNIGIGFAICFGTMFALKLAGK